MSENIPISLHPGGDVRKREGMGEGGRQEAAARSLHFSIFIKFFGNAPGQLIYGNKGALTVSHSAPLFPLPASLSMPLSLSFCFPLWLNGNALVMLWSIDGSLWRCVASCRVTEAEVPVSIIYLVVYSNNNKNGIQKISCLLLCNSNICTVSWRASLLPPLSSIVRVLYCSFWH